MTEIEWKATREQVETLVEQTIRRMFGERGMPLDDIDISARQARAVEAAMAEAERIFSISRGDILSRHRNGRGTLARFCIAVALRDFAYMPLKKIARALNRRDHSTVLYMLRKHSAIKNPRIALITGGIADEITRAMKDEGEGA